MSVREALIASKNVPTVHLAQAVGRSRVAALAGRAGIDGVSLEPSMALGTVAVSPLELTAAYTAFAADGMRAAPRLVLRVETLDGRDAVDVAARAHRASWTRASPSSSPKRCGMPSTGAAARG